MARWPAGSPGGVGGRYVNSDDLDEFMKSLHDAGAQAPGRLRLSLNEGAEAVASEARKIAIQHSTSIPPTIKVVSDGKTAAVEAGEGVPLAALYELGNASGAREGTFVHPLWGNRNAWFPQDRYPFMAPAMVTAGPGIDAAVEKVADDIVRVVIGLGE